MMVLKVVEMKKTNQGREYIERRGTKKKCFMNSNFRADRQRGTTSKGDWEEMGKEVRVKQERYVVMKMKRIELFLKTWVGLTLWHIPMKGHWNICLIK